MIAVAVSCSVVALLIIGVAVWCVIRRPKKPNTVAPTLPVTLPKEALPKEALPEAVLPEAAVESSSGEAIKGACAKCGKPVFAAQERIVGESGAYSHTNAKDCTVD